MLLFVEEVIVDVSVHLHDTLFVAGNIGRLAFVLGGESFLLLQDLFRSFHVSCSELLHGSLGLELFRTIKRMLDGVRVSRDLINGTPTAPHGHPSFDQQMKKDHCHWFLH